MKKADSKSPDIAEADALLNCLARFQKAWNSDSPQTIEQVLASYTPTIAQDELGIHLIQCEVELRRQKGEIPHLDDYANRFPELDSDVLDELVSLPAPPPPSLSEPRLPARYQLIREIGKGGIGSVWRVHDSHLDRPLAAKVLLPKFRFDTAANARMDREALLTGSLQHPGVPPIHDRGKLVSGASFFTMKLVDGQTLAEILKTGFQSIDQDRPRQLGIFEQVAQTLAYAHSQGIIHRDLKPHNVMVGRFGEVQIMDWGMAKRLVDDDRSNPAGRGPGNAVVSPADAATSDAATNNAATIETASQSTDSSIDPTRSLTRQGDVFGTPAYMPPEQARGDRDAMSERSDVFGLGAILFEILTGARLYDNVSDRDLMGRVLNCEYQPSIALLQSSGIDEELVQICQQCLQKLPSDRPPNAQHVAAAISEYLASVESRVKQAELDRTAAEVKVVAESKRRRIVLFLASVIVAVALLGLAGVAWQWNHAVQSGELARTESQRAKANFEKLLHAVERMLTRVGNEKLDQLPYMKTVRRELLQDALLFYQQILEQDVDSPQLILEVAEAHRLVGKIHYLLSEYPEAMEHNREAIELLQSLDGLLSQHEIDRPMAYLLESVARIEKRLGHLPLAEDAYVEAVRIRSDLVAAVPGEPELIINLSDSLRGLGNVRKKQGNLSAATTVVDEAIRYLNKVVADDPKNSEAWLALAACYQEYGSLENKRGQPEASRSFYQQAVNVLDPLLGADDGANEDIKAELSRYLNNLATMQRSLGQIDESESSHLRTIELRSQLARDFPNTPEYRNMLATSYINLGVVYKQNDRPKEAKRLYDQAIEVLVELSDEFSNVPEYRSSLGITLHNLANFLEVTQRNERAVELRMQAIEVFQKLADEFPATPYYQHVLGFACNDLAIQCERRGRTPEAIRAANQAVAIRQILAERFPDNRPYQLTLASSRGLKAWILAMVPDPKLRDPATAFELAESATVNSPKDPKNIRALGAALFRNAQYVVAIEALMDNDPEQSRDPAVGYLLAMSYWKADNQTMAREWFEKAEEFGKATAEKPDVNLSPIRDEAVQVLGLNSNDCFLFPIISEPPSWTGMRRSRYQTYVFCEPIRC